MSNTYKWIRLDVFKQKGNPVSILIIHSTMDVFDESLPIFLQYEAVKIRAG